MKIVADEGVDRHIVNRLRRGGFEVYHIAEIEPSVSDEAVLARANESGALLVTADKDFGDLVFRRRLASDGVRLLRLEGMTAEAKAEAVHEVVAQRGEELVNAFGVLSPGVLRVRPRL